MLGRVMVIPAFWKLDSGGNLVVLGVAVLATGVGDEVGTIPENDGVVIC